MSDTGLGGGATIRGTQDPAITGAPVFGINTGARRVDDDRSAAGIAGRSVAEWMRWAGQYVQGRTYKRHDVVRDGEWTMIATPVGAETTAERPGFVPAGPAAPVYDGLDPTSANSAVQITSGQRYAFSASGYIAAYRIYTVTGNVYRVFSVGDPLGAVPEFSDLQTFEATATGWQTFPVGVIPVSVGTVFDLGYVVSEPDPTPVEIPVSYNYFTPNNNVAPLAGQCVHANLNIGVLRFHKTDSDLVDRGAILLALNVGDVLSTVAGDWSVQVAPVDQGDFVDIAVAPQLQQGADGVRTFTLQTETASPITEVFDLDHHAGNADVEGFRAIDGGYPNAVFDDSQYGIDVFVTPAIVPTDWELVAWGNA